MDSIEFVFHVVNSVKGGCGKSTFSLWLAEYWRDKGEKVYIIDLDTNGTSWKDELATCCDDEYGLYINDFVNDYRLITSINPWVRINSKKVFNYLDYETLKNESGNRSMNYPTNFIHICWADPQKRSNKITYQVDLFEQVVSELLKNIVIMESDEKFAKKESTIKATEKRIVETTSTIESTDRIYSDYRNESIILPIESKMQLNKRIHVIFDMAPGNDERSEAILKHLLMSNEFFMFKGKYKYKYKINLYILSTVTNASINASFQYIKQLITKPQNYNMVDFNDLTIRIIFNDVSNCINDNKWTPAINLFYQGMQKNGLNDKNEKNDVIIKFGYMPHIDRAHIQEQGDNTIFRDLMFAYLISKWNENDTLSSDTVAYNSPEVLFGDC